MHPKLSIATSRGRRVRSPDGRIAIESIEINQHGLMTCNPDVNRRQMIEAAQVNSHHDDMQDKRWMLIPLQMTEHREDNFSRSQWMRPGR